MKLNKLLCVMIALFAINTAAYAVEISVGASFGAGMPMFRGTNAKEMTSYDIMKESFPDAKKTTFALVPQIDVMIEFIPFLALETGVGFKYSTLKYSDSLDMGGTKAEISYSFTRSEIYIPVMLRGQFEYSLGVTYVSAGVKLGIPISDYSAVEVKVADFPDFNIEEKIKASPFTLDIAFALGQEFKLGTSHYVGVRVGYDLNVMRPYATSDYTKDPKEGTYPDTTDLFQDNFSVALTYRYAFGR